MTSPVRSLPGICAVRTVRGAAATTDAAPDLIIEVPHGATRRRHYDALRSLLRGPFPDDLVAFFLVNTDAGAPELAGALADRLVADAPTRSVVIVTSEIPRTFIDCNRVIDASPEEFRAGGVSPGLPPYVRDPQDKALLRERHAAYVEVTDAAFAWVCGAGGLGLMAHTYAPRTVDVEVDDEIVKSLRRAYAPDVVETWPLRSPIDIIARDTEGNVFAAPFVERTAAAFRAAGLETSISSTYPMHPSTLAYHHARRYLGQILCLEVRRDLLVDRFEPFAEAQPVAERIARVVDPLATAIRGAWGSPSSVADAG